MALTTDQKKQLLEQARARRPEMTRDEARSLLETAEQRSSQENTNTNVTGDKLEELKPYRDIGQNVSQDFGTQVRAGFVSAPYQRIEEEPNIIDKAVRGISQYAPSTFATIAGTIARPLGRKMGATAAGAAYGVGTGFGEGLENLRGIQDETPEERLREQTIDPIKVGATDFAFDLGFEKAGKLLSSMGKKISSSGVVKSVANKVDDVVKDDIIAQFNPAKSIRKEARKRDINIAQEVIDGKYGDDALQNIDVASKRISDLSSSLEEMIGASDKKINAGDIVDSVASDMKKKARGFDQKEAIDKWAEFMKSDRFTDGNVSLVSALQEKTLAGKSGYKKGGDVVTGFVGQAEAKLERGLRQAIVDALPKQGKDRFEQIMKQQEANIFLLNMFEDAADSGKPLSIAKRVGRLFNPMTVGQETAGEAAEFGFRKTIRPAFSSEKTMTSDPSRIMEMLKNSVAPGSSSIMTTASQDQGGGIDAGYVPENKEVNLLFKEVYKKDKDLAFDVNTMSKIAKVLSNAKITDIESSEAKKIISKSVDLIKKGEIIEKETENRNNRSSNINDLAGLDVTSTGQTNGISTLDVGGYKSPEGVPFYR